MHSASPHSLHLIPGYSYYWPRLLIRDFERIIFFLDIYECSTSISESDCALAGWQPKCSLFILWSGVTNEGISHHDIGKKDSREAHVQ